MELIWGRQQGGLERGEWGREEMETLSVLARGKWQLLSLLKASPHPPGSFTFPFNMSFLEEKPIFNEFKCQVWLCRDMGFYPFPHFATLWCVRGKVWHQGLRFSWKIKPCQVGSASPDSSPRVSETLILSWSHVAETRTLWGKGIYGKKDSVGTMTLLGQGLCGDKRSSGPEHCWGPGLCGDNDPMETRTQWQT